MNGDGPDEGPSPLFYPCQGVPRIRELGLPCGFGTSTRRVYLMRFRFLVSLAALALAAAATLALAGAATPAPARAQAVQTTNVTVVMREYTFTLSKNVVPRGKVVFTVVNKGDVGHDFVIGALKKKTPVIGPGARRTLIVTFTKAGRFMYLCSVGEHFFHGMKGTLRVR
jgi:plastocyanin